MGKVVNGWVVFAGFALVACGDETRTCTTELRTAVIVNVSSPDGLPVSAVTSALLGEQPCEGGPTKVAGFDYRYLCYEQGEGVYKVRVKSDALTWTQRASLGSDGCHVDGEKTLNFVLDPATAD